MDVTMLERALQGTRAVVAGTRRDQLGEPTPCTEWDVRELLNHIIGGLDLFATGAEKGSAEMPTEDYTAEDHVAAFDRHARRVVEAFSAPGVMEKTLALPWGEMPAGIALSLETADATVHGWDLATATGQDLALDPELAEAVYGMTSKMMEPNGSMPRGDSFGPPVDVPDDAPVQDRMLAYMGRRP